jgi:extracellular factor (EF) 3-hydroxypalmitic acid methyl ester biosynthesis protein
MDQAKHAILEFSEFHTIIDEYALSDYIVEYHQRLEIIEGLTLGLPDERKQLMALCFLLCGKELEKSLVCKHTRTKPFGYSGDFQAIDWILTEKSDSPGIGALWDKFYQSENACKSVRNRANFLINLVNELSSDGKIISILNLACGSCRDVSRIFSSSTKHDFLHFLCVDMDARAISYAKSLLPSNKNIILREANAFFLSPSSQYDVVWASGLFDYLTDRQAIILLKKMWLWTASNGQLIFGNFLNTNNSKLLMEWCLGWFLIYRKPHEIIELAIQAGIPENAILFKSDEAETMGLCTCRKI